jgi:hypothetical protein
MIRGWLIETWRGLDNDKANIIHNVTNQKKFPNLPEEIEHS